MLDEWIEVHAALQMHNPLARAELVSDGSCVHGLALGQLTQRYAASRSTVLDYYCVTRVHHEPVPAWT